MILEQRRAMIVTFFPKDFYKTPWSVLGGQEWGIWMIQTLKLLLRHLGLSKLELHKETRFLYRLQVSYFLECWSYKDRTMSWCLCSLSYLLLLLGETTWLRKLFWKKAFNWGLAYNFKVISWSLCGSRQIWCWNCSWELTSWSVLSKPKERYWT